MRDAIVVVGAGEEQSQELCAALEREEFRTIPSDSLVKLEKNIRRASRHVVILDLDIFPVDNLFIRNLRRQYPGACIIALSSRSFHPELKEAMSKHIYACLGKPVDTEELIYWTRSICED